MEDFETSALPESSGHSGEAVREKSEKQREAYKKAQSQLQKSQKDEKKAKGDNDDLFSILFRFIQNPYYESLIPVITELLQNNIPSRVIIGITALVYPESALYVLTKLDKKTIIDSLLGIHRYPEKITFDESSLHHSIRTWMSHWVQFSGNYLVNPDSSVILEQKLLQFIKNSDTRILLERAISQFLFFFFSSRNLEISTKVTDGYADFILREYQKILEKSLDGADSDLMNLESPDQVHLFGLG